MATYVIGDIQGCYREFRQLLSAAGYRAATDELWLVGDLVNRGPANVDVLRFLMDTPHVTTVLGNHDLHFVAVARGFKRPSGRDTISDLLDASDVDEFVDWLRARPLVHVDEDRRAVLVHAGLPPHWRVDECRARAQEVERTLASDEMDAFLAEMYGNEPDRWQEDLAGNARLRLITNYFTRLRFCRGDGTIELESKETEAPAGFSPWFEFPRPDDFTIYFGHWAALEGHTTADFAVALDTGCVWGREMTALRLEDGRRFSVPSETRG